MNFTKCDGSAVALEYNEKYLHNVKLACYCPYCCMMEKREATPYKIIKTANGFMRVVDESYYEKDKKEEEDKSDDELDEEDLQETNKEDYDFVNDYIEDEEF